MASFTLSLTASQWGLPLGVQKSMASNSSFKTQVIAGTQREGGRGRGRGRDVWRRRKLTKKDDMLRYNMERVPFLEEQVRMVKEGGQLLGMDIEKLLLKEENRFDFVNEIAAEANKLVENDRDKYGGKKKAILQVLSDRVNEQGFYRPDAYEESEPYKPGRGWMRDYYT